MDTYFKNLKDGISDTVSNLIWAKPFPASVRCGKLKASILLYALPNIGDEFDLAFIDDNIQRSCVVTKITHYMLSSANNTGDFDLAPAIIIDII